VNHDLTETALPRKSDLARLPRFRKPWMSEDYRMSIFDAVALAIAFFQFQKGKRGALISRAPYILLLNVLANRSQKIIQLHLKLM